MPKLPYLNLGCGYRFHNEWTNIDFTSTGEGVIAHNLLQPFPFENDSFEVVYHSHVLEHIPSNKAKAFINECFRVLKPNGIIRIAVPDLEQIAKNYTSSLNQVLLDPTDIYKQSRYDWNMLEMYDQAVRNTSGGEMMRYLCRNEIDKEYIIQRCGQEVIDILNKLQKHPISYDIDMPKIEKINYIKEIYRLIKYPQKRERLIKILLGHEYEALKIGRFRLGGEIHQWMYDRYSISNLLTNCGFSNFTVKTAYESNIPEWNKYKLEVTNDNKVNKPDSLFVEAFKKII
ncbi:MAG: methyltransferase domain-containing protein [Cytophagales bacterium]|nr:methyltransferase domain-containing protein [Cytophagales bacterium]